MSGLYSPKLGFVVLRHAFYIVYIDILYVVCNFSSPIEYILT